MVLILVALVLLDIEIPKIGNVGFQIAISCVIVLSCIGGLSMYYLSLGRLIRVFEPLGQFKIGKIKIVIYIIVIIIVVTLLCFYASSYFIFKDELFDPYPNLIIIVANTGIILNMITALSIVYQFIHNLSIVIQERGSTSTTRIKLIQIVNVAIYH